MVNLRMCALFVITLLQLCRAEISDAQPEWHSANVINDDFQPKSISEIFSTESSFSSTNPIIVLSKSSAIPEEIQLLSSLGPLKKPVVSPSTPSGFTKVTVATPSTPTVPPTQKIEPTSTERPSTPSPTLLPSQTPSPTLSTALPPSSIYTLPPSPRPNESPPSPDKMQVQQTTLAVPKTTLFERETTQPQTLMQIQPQLINVEGLPLLQVKPLVNQPGQNLYQIGQQPAQTPQVPKEPLSNFFVIYQQAPQNFQGLPSALPGPRDIPNIVAIPSTTPTPTQTSSTPTSTSPAPTPTSPILITNPVPTVQTLPAVSQQSIPTTSRPLPCLIQTSPSFGLNSAQTLNSNCPQLWLQAITPIPRPISFGGAYPVSIRVVAPLGSITNVKINPTTSTTTRRPTTTRTKRTRKPKRNTYERCVEACKGAREPICAIPLASTPIDVNTLKGFPTVCHMACHNSYRKEPYEKLSDGRCGRLRTRIQAVGTKTKLTRDELNKSQYTVVSSGPQTIVEFSGLP